MRSILKRLSRRHTTAVAYLALFAALGGSAYAAVTVTGKNIKDGTVTGRDVKNRSLGTSKLSPTAVSSLTGRIGPAGPQGEEGAPGPAGPKGTGPVGPTFATAFSNSQAPTPPATPDTALLNGQYSHTFVTPTSGRLLVFGSLKHLSVTCSVGNGNGFLYLDGVGVQGSGQLQPNITPADPFTPIALTDVVPAGQHTLTIAVDCPTGNKMGDSSSGDGKLGAVLIGG